MPVLLATCLWVLLVPARVGGRPFAGGASGGCLLLLLWLLARFGVLCVHPLVALPDWMAGAGLPLLADGAPSAALMGAHLLAAAFVGAMSRAGVEHRARCGTGMLGEAG